MRWGNEPGTAGTDTGTGGVAGAGGGGAGGTAGGAAGAGGESSTTGGVSYAGSCSVGTDCDDGVCSAEQECLNSPLEVLASQRESTSVQDFWVNVELRATEFGPIVPNDYELRYYFSNDPALNGSPLHRLSVHDTSGACTASLVQDDEFGLRWHAEILYDLLTEASQWDGGLACEFRIHTDAPSPGLVPTSDYSYPGDGAVSQRTLQIPVFLVAEPETVVYGIPLVL